MLLIFHRAGTDRHITHHIGKIGEIIRIQHFIRCTKTGFFQNSPVQIPNRIDSFCKVRILLRIRLMQHSFIAFSCRPRLIGIDSRNDENLIRDILFHFF